MTSDARRNPALVRRTRSTAMAETTREQDHVVNVIATHWGRAAVRELPAGAVLVVGMADDVEMCHAVVDEDGHRRPATSEELRAWGPRANGLFASTEPGGVLPGVRTARRMT